MKNLILSFCLLTIFASSTYAADVQITGSGIGAFQIGKSPPILTRDMLVFRKWEKDQNGVAYEVIRARLNGVIIDAEIYRHKVWRIATTSNKVKTVEGI